MRHITSHIVNPANDKIDLVVLDEPGPGGACHEYEIILPGKEYYLDFQNGPIATDGVNGITHEVLLAILIDRLTYFQAGPYACTENAQALIKLQEAQHWLQARTRERMERGVEGTHLK